MININPFAELSASIDPVIMQIYIIVMVVLVAGGTIFDMLHKKSAQYFFAKMQKNKAEATREVGAGEKVSLAIQTALVEGATSAEFCNPMRRIAHLLTMYGFVAYAAATAIMVFGYPTAATPAPAPALLANLWYLGALMVCVGGYWFWFFIRVDVSAEGNSPFRLVRADLFIVSLMVSTTFALIWAYAQSTGGGIWTTIFLGLYLLSTTVLFGSVPWSKFSHMFFKPAAALEKRISAANGTRANLPEPADRTDPAVRDSHSMELLKDAPQSMGLGIKREQPNHY
jgi:hypothetical protein